MWNQFILENLHFTVNLFAALAFFAVAWLYLDAWLLKKNLKDLFKIIGFILISISFVFLATYIETTLLASPLLGKNITINLVLTLRIIGYFLIALGLALDPLQKRPTAAGIASNDKNLSKQAPPALTPAIAILSTGIFSVFKYAQIAIPILAFLVASLYFRKATVGLEKHLRKISLAFFLISLYELLSLTRLFENTENIDLYNLIAPFKPVWIGTQLVLLAGVWILLRWSWTYLLKRLLSQLFMIYISTVLAIFLLVTVSFTYLLLKNLQAETSSQLQTDVKVLSYALDSKKAQTLSDAELLSQNSQIIKGTVEGDRAILGSTAQDFLITKKASTILILDRSGRVIARGEDNERIGDSFSDDPLFKRTVSGDSTSSVIVEEGVLAPSVSIISASPIKAGSEIVGAVIIGSSVDNAFIDGVQKATGLQTSIYADNRLSATTILTSDGRTRANGIKEENPKINSAVLDHGQEISLPVNILNTPYFGAYAPLVNIDNKTVGMLFVGKPQIGVLQAASRSIELTFFAAVILLILSIIPSYLISKYISGQVK